MLRQQLDNRCLDVSCHVGPVAANVQQRLPLQEPLGKLSPLLHHAVLHVHLGVVTAREGRRERHSPTGAEALELLLVQEVLVGVPASEKEPHRTRLALLHALVLEAHGEAAPRAIAPVSHRTLLGTQLVDNGDAMLDEANKGRDPRARPDHDDGALRILRELEVPGRRVEDRNEDRLLVQQLVLILAEPLADAVQPVGAQPPPLVP
mmetsp:Transcript_63521/g.156379  ORF Transcript_63521/g.156379 Transcript_63521/m.156379 type:complete len:206 (-) Transcript_63521:963-1580(-)